MPQAAAVQAFISGEKSYIAGLLPSKALNIPGSEILDWLDARLGQDTVDNALDPELHFPSPVAHWTSGGWMRSANMVGINVRTIGSFWNVIKYALTIPAHQNAIHLLPIWEPGVVASLYGMSSWNINPEFFSPELAKLDPNLDTVERQLKAVTNLLHALGKTVGMDVIPHTDRYAEIVLANPAYFEWLVRRNDQILEHGPDLYKKVQIFLLEVLQLAGPADQTVFYIPDPVFFFSEEFPERLRLQVLFGKPEDQWGRIQRRKRFIQYLYEQGVEPVPATMGPPYRGLEVDPNEKAMTIDEDGRIWRDYRITKPQAMSRVFGPLTRYKLHETGDENDGWALDFNRPKPEVWQYVQDRYREVQHKYGFDFMRGDMSHVQMRPAGVPAQPMMYYDIHQEIKKNIQREKPWFGYYAESFLAPAGHMAYGDEVDHLELSEADATLGDLQSMTISTSEFQQTFRLYLDILHSRSVAPCFTIMTADKDDPRFDLFYLAGNEARMLMGLLLTDMPSYMGLGFECRDVHHSPAPNEHYTKLYVFQEKMGPKATKGPYRWGENTALFANIDRLRHFAEQEWSWLQHAKVKWLLPPDATAQRKYIAWTYEQHRYIVVVNLDLDQALCNGRVPMMEAFETGKAIFSTHRPEVGELELSSNSRHYLLPEMIPGEGMVFKEE